MAEMALLTELVTSSSDPLTGMKVGDVAVDDAAGFGFVGVDAE